MSLPSEDFLLPQNTTCAKFGMEVLTPVPRNNKLNDPSEIDDVIIKGKNVGAKFNFNSFCPFWDYYVSIYYYYSNSVMSQNR